MLLVTSFPVVGAEKLEDARNFHEKKGHHICSQWEVVKLLFLHVALA